MMPNMLLKSLWSRMFGTRSATGTTVDDGAMSVPLRNARIEQAEPLLNDVRSRLNAGDVDGAMQMLDQAPDGLSESPEHHLLRARALRMAGRPLEAASACEAALPTAQDPSHVHVELALCWLSVPDLQAAVDALHVAVTLDENNGHAWLQLGETWRRLEQMADAQQAYREAIGHLSQDKDRAQAWFCLGQALMHSVDVVEAQAAFQQAKALDPDLIEVNVGLGNAALWLDQENDAVVHYEEAMRRVARPARQLLLNYGSALQNCGRFDEAQRLFQRVLAEHPKDHASRWYLCQLDLALCNWRRGWPNYPSRFGSGATLYRPMPFAPWDGRPVLDSTVLILADEGLGDEIMYASCIADAAANCRHLIVECETRLEPIFRRSFPQVHVVGTRRENDATWLAGLPKPDWQMPSGDLPGVYRLDDEDFPAHDGYLRADPIRVQAWKDRLASLGPGLKIGLSWRGGTSKTRSKTRTLSAEHWGPILGVPGATFVNLQYGKYQGELAELRSLHGIEIHDFPEAISDYEETAALVCALDLVITVCTAIVHLAGSMGRPVWVLTPLSPGWRYTAKRDRMPWYPSSRLFRQKEWGDWTPVCQEVSFRLTELTKQVGTGRLHV